MRKQVKPQEDLPENLIEESGGELLLRVRRATVEQEIRAYDSLNIHRKALVTALTDPYILVDAEHEIIEWNPAMVAWSGVVWENAVGRPLVEVLEDEIVNRYEVALISYTDEFPDAGGHAVCVDGPLQVRRNLYAAEIVLIPLYRIPYVLEAIAILFRPGLKM